MESSRKIAVGATVAVLGAGAIESFDQADPNALPPAQERVVTDINQQAHIGKVSLSKSVAFENASYTYSPQSSNSTGGKAVAFSADKPKPYTMSIANTSSTQPHTQVHHKYPHNYPRIWDKLAMCESTLQWHLNSGNGFYGGIQFTRGSWHAVGGSGTANQHSKYEQVYRGQKLQRSQGWGAWPVCSRKLGLR